MKSKSFVISWGLEEDGIVSGLYDPKTNKYREPYRKFKPRELTRMVYSMVDNLFQKEWKTYPGKPYGDAAVVVAGPSSKPKMTSDKAEITISAEEVEGDVNVTIFVKGGDVKDSIADSDVTIKGATVKDVKINHYVVVDGGSAGKIANSKVTLEGGKFG